MKRKVSTYQNQTGQFFEAVYRVVVWTYGDFHATQPILKKRYYFSAFKDFNTCAPN